ncbi:hypothetical protein A9K82_11760 [Enterobacter kobei]|uniref:hypothetical protein n=1 Tax=Enterobacter kobei TaxID=208224 RepID=UPI000B3C0E6C|nr:hypothetical protein [Enterobacter kobei]OUS61749.1 hypothetical protein A9K83_01930 [Enterobacter kobei]OUS66145.1 hypothetical protein A9K84_01555 [Enterobacter kobei]OUS67203.1 hypothetical protein A9K82_11760 [Enterobacter kobei]HBL7319990.1 hypothetical protein [Enterobacter kobei]
MEIHVPMEVVVSDGEERFTELDFYYGSKALEGTSEIVTVLTNTILNREVVTKIPSIEGITASFRTSYEGSFRQRFMLKITGDEQKRNYEAIGEGAFLDVMSYYLTRPLLTPYNFSYKRASRIVEELEPDYRSLMKRLYGPLLKLHKPIEEQNYKVELKRRRTNLVSYDNSTLENLTIERADAERIFIEASITRFNRLTGTGRLILEEDSESVSFEPFSLWREFPLEQRRKLSRNLDVNTDNANFTRLRLEVTAIRNFLGDIKKYSLHRVVMD